MTDWNPWDRTEPYCWVVICKNRRLHNQQNIFSGHKIPLGETDAFAPPPKVDFQLLVRCDKCGEEYSYGSAEVLRFEMELPKHFAPHPLFR
jgi:hypothetical protein